MTITLYPYLNLRDNSQVCLAIIVPVLVRICRIAEMGRIYKWSYFELLRAVAGVGGRRPDCLHSNGSPYMYHGSNDIGIGHDGYPVRAQFADPVDLEPLIVKALNIPHAGPLSQHFHSVPMTYLETLTGRGDAMNPDSGTGADGSVNPHPVDGRPRSCGGIARSNLNDSQNRIINSGSSRPSEQDNTDSDPFGTIHHIHASGAKGAANITNPRCQYIQANTDHCIAPIVPQATTSDYQRIIDFHNGSLGNQKSSNESEKYPMSEKMIHDGGYIGDVFPIRMDMRPERNMTFIRSLPAAVISPSDETFNDTSLPKGKIRTERTEHQNQTAIKDPRSTLVPRIAGKDSFSSAQTPTSGVAASVHRNKSLQTSHMKSVVSPNNAGTNDTSWGIGNQASINRPWARSQPSTRTGLGDHTSIDCIDTGAPDSNCTALGPQTLVADSPSHVKDGLASSSTLECDLKAVPLASVKTAVGEAIYAEATGMNDDKTGKCEDKKAKMEEKPAYVEEDKDW